MSDQDEPKMLRDKIAQITREKDEIIEGLQSACRQLGLDNMKMQKQINALMEELDTAKLRLAERV